MLLIESPAERVYSIDQARAGEHRHETRKRLPVDRCCTQENKYTVNQEYHLDESENSEKEGTKQLVVIGTSDSMYVMIFLAGRSSFFAADCGR